MEGLRVVDHPVLARAVTVLRATRRRPGAFRDALEDASWTLAYEALRDMPLEESRSRRRSRRPRARASRGR